MKKHIFTHLIIGLSVIAMSFLIAIVENWITPVPNLYDSITHELISSIPYFIFGVVLYWTQYYKEEDKNKTHE